MAMTLNNSAGFKYLSGQSNVFGEASFKCEKKKAIVQVINMLSSILIVFVRAFTPLLHYYFISLLCGTQFEMKIINLSQC